MSTAMDLTLPGNVVDGDWLQARLEHPDLRIVDATVVLDPSSWEANSGRARYEQGHIPGATFVDLIAELSDPAGDEGLPEGVHAYQLPPAEQVAAALARHGIGDATTVIAYDTAGGMWAARLWWTLRVLGHEQVAVLDGGWERWRAQGRPQTTAEPRIAPASPLTPRWQPGLYASKEDVTRAIDDQGTVLVNALWPEQFRGEVPLERPGRIPGSVNVPFSDVLDDDGTLRDLDALRARFAAEGVDEGAKAITYCGGGIAASLGALALAELGVDVALYDGSLTEWTADPQAPLETG